MSDGLFTVSREFVDRVEERVGMGAGAWDCVRAERICEAVIAEWEASRAAPSAAPGEAVAWYIVSGTTRRDSLGVFFREQEAEAACWRENLTDARTTLGWSRTVPLFAAPVRVSEAWRDVWKYLAHRDDDEFECREHRDGPGTCDCGLTPAVDRLTAALAAQEGSRG